MVLHTVLFSSAEHEMDIIVGDIFSRIANPMAVPSALALIRGICRARPKGYQYMPKFRAKHWDGYVSLMSTVASFPSGLVEMVKCGLEEKGYRVNLVYAYNKCTYTTVTDDFLDGITLRKYQVDAANALLSAGRGVAKMATNSGKTEVMAALIKAIGFRKTLVLLHREELLYQTAERFSKRLGIEVGMIGDGNWQPKNVTVAMIQTLASKLKKFDPAGNTLLMIDECHHAPSARMLDAMQRIPGQFRFGFSGTPLSNDVLSDMKLIAYTGEIVVEVSNDFMIEEGFSAKPVINISIVEDLDDSNWEMPYSDAYDRLIVNNETRNKRIAELAKSSSGTVLILIERIAHGKILKKLISKSVFISGSDTTEKRQKALHKMNDGGVYIATTIFDEGIDVPNINTLILAGGGRSYHKMLQRIGRGLRKKSDNRLVVYDFIDDTNFYLLRHSQRRIDVYAEEGFETTVI